MLGRVRKALRRGAPGYCHRCGKPLRGRIVTDIENGVLRKYHQRCAPTMLRNRMEVK